MTDFETEAAVSIAIEERELRQARQTIEDGIGDVEVGVAGGAGGGGAGGGRPPEMQTDGGSSRQQRRNRREHRWDRSRTNDIEDILELLERADFGGDGGGGLAGGLMDLGGDLGGALAGALPAGVGAAVGSAVGPVISDAVSGAEVSVAEPGEIPEPEWLPMEVREPEWELDIEEIADLDVEEPTLGVDAPELSVDDPSPLGVDDPVLAVDHPDSPYDVDHPERPYEVERPTLQVDAPESIPVTFEAAAAQPAETTEDGRGRGAGAEHGIAAGVHEDAPLTETREALGVAGANLATRAMGGDPEDTSTVLPIFGEIGGGGGSPSTSAPSASGGTQEVNVDHSPTYRVEVDPRRLDDLADDIVAAIEDDVERDLRAIEDEVDEIRSEFEDFRDGITR